VLGLLGNFNLNKNIAGILALTITIAYITVVIVSAVLKVEVSNEFSMIEMAIISYYFGSSNSKGGERDDTKDDGKI